LNLVDPGTLKAFLSRHGVSATKGLGQHFLCSRSTVDSIVSALGGCRGVLEVGPGPGVLTAPISQAVDKMVALEVDPRMVSALAESAPTAEVRLADALETDLLKILGSLPEPRGLVSNMPYYITGPLLTRFAEAKQGWSVAVLMMQREVAEKVLAPVGDRNRGSLSVFLQSQFDIRLLTHVPPGAFLPPPKVESTVLKLVPNGREFSESFFRLIRLSFAQPRKTLANNLAFGLRQPRDQVLTAMEQVGIEELARPQTVTVEQWERLAGILDFRF
jgi:16S rRNA (adenine1518-N6/adenine1519-N6)-dimethyltransferase